MTPKIFFLTTSILACLSFQGHTSTTIDLQLQRLTAQGWFIEGIQFSLGPLGFPIQQFKLGIRRLSLPKPFQQLSFLDIECPNLSVTPKQLLCRQGQAHLQVNQTDIFSVSFSLTLTGKTVSLQLTSPADLGVHQLALNLSLDGSQWQLDFNAKNLILANVYTLGVANLAQLEGTLDLQGRLAGTGEQITELELFLAARQLTLGTTDAHLATEQLDLTATIQAERSTLDNWRVTSNIQINNGLFYAQPLYFEIKDKPLQLVTRLHWFSQSRLLDILHVDLLHPGTGRLQGNAKLTLDRKPLIQHLQAYLVSSDLSQLYTVYVKPFIEATSWAETQITGKASIQIQVDNDQLSHLSSQFEALDLNDSQGRFEIVGGQGYIDWQRHQWMRSSRFLWQSARLFSIPLGAVDVKVAHNLDRLVIANNTRIPVIDGHFLIQQLSVHGLQKEYPKLRFKGELMPISLEKLSEILDWPPLTGSLAGSIPGISYHQGEFKIDGQLQARVFDGEIVINHLKIAGLLGALPRLTADCQLNHLNMSLLTHQFGFGAMEGGLEGYIRDLYLENWHLVSFDAWLGTPEEDDFRHRISQKAVDNITSLGGGGTSNMISRSLLRFFDSFAYDRIGIGCKLNQGVCEMSGVGLGRGGYYIIKGSGLPRMDIIGYSPRINWQELLQRLSSIEI